MPNRFKGMAVNARNVEKTLHDFCLGRTKAGKDCGDCLIKDYCHSFLQITPALNLALQDVIVGRNPPPFNGFLKAIRGGK